MNRERLHRITVEVGKCGGRPCIRGQRIRVTDVLELLGAGASFDEILRDYPFLARIIREKRFGDDFFARATIRE
jgi:uncharacterized protein (DUF433 family)